MNQLESTTMCPWFSPSHPVFLEGVACLYHVSAPGHAEEGRCGVNIIEGATCERGWRVKHENHIARRKRKTVSRCELRGRSSMLLPEPGLKTDTSTLLFPCRVMPRESQPINAQTKRGAAYGRRWSCTSQPLKSHEVTPDSLIVARSVNKSILPWCSRNQLPLVVGPF